MGYVDSIRDSTKPRAWYKVLVNNIDVTEFVNESIEVTDQEDLMRSCFFTLEGKEFINKVARFHKIVIYGGSEDSNNQGCLFRGIVKGLVLNFPKSGRPSLSIEGFGNSFKSTRESKNIAYPDPKNPRQWARKSPLKLSTIVGNIFKEQFDEFPVYIDIVKDTEFTFKKQFIQKSSDWVALRELARISECILSEKNSLADNEEHIISFIDRRKALDDKANKTDLAFVYLERDIDSSFLISYLKKGEIAVDSITFNMNVDLNSGSLRLVSDFSQTDGKDKIFLQQYDKASDNMITYELKPSAYFDKAHLSDEKLDKFWNRLTYNWGDVTFDEIKEFFNPVDPSTNTVPGYEDDAPGFFGGAGPVGWVGYEITVEVAGDVRITPYSKYPIYGIGKYSSKDDGSNKYFLRSIVHNLDNNGMYTQTLNFYR